MDKRPIGIFDSGVGGLTVLREVEKLLPKEDIIYFGDTARVPYGNKSRPTVIKFTTQSILFLLRKKVKMAIIACNTSSSLALDSLKNAFSLPIMGVIESGVRKALKSSSNNKIAVIGTRSTIASRSYEKAIRKINKTIRIYAQSCPLFVPLAEESLLHGAIAKAAIGMYLRKIKQAKPGVLILGCTHYPLLKRPIADYLKGTYIVDSAREVALEAKALLTSKGLLNSQGGSKEFYVSDEPTGFVKLAKLFLHRQIRKPKIVNV